MKKVILPTAFFTLTPLVLILSLFLLSYSHKGNVLSLSKQTPKIAFAALPKASGTLKMNISSEDMRIKIVRDFFKKYKSTLTPYADDVIEAADKYEIDYRLIPAIAMQESNLCKKIIKDSYNCWGFGIYGKKVTRFENYNQAINIVSKTLAMQYKSKGLETPEQIMTKYTPGSNGSWANGVNHFMDQLNINL
nr:glucosaminidase domain-containing protein [Candidatus Levybacteria bacterium]